jgi:hypothetical protein
MIDITKGKKHQERKKFKIFQHNIMGLRDGYTNYSCFFFFVFGIAEPFTSTTSKKCGLKGDS